MVLPPSLGFVQASGLEIVPSTDFQSNYVDFFFFEIMVRDYSSWRTSFVNGVCLFVVVYGLMIS